MAWFESPTSFRLRELAASSTFIQPRSVDAQAPFLMSSDSNATMGAFADPPPPHSSHPDFLHLAGLVCEAVLEVVFVALPGFLVAWTGMFDAKSQKFVAELNTMVFTPCLVFTKLASQLNSDKLADLAVIPLIFIAQTLISWLSSQAMARLFGFGRQKRPKNFIIAMGVFGNSNSLPISLVLSLSHTISGLHWDKIPGDNDNEVGARGILYLLIFQQLGQLLRWTWGYSVLLKPKAAYEEEEREAGADEHRIEEEGRYRDEPEPMNGHSKPVKPLDSGFASGNESTSSNRSVSSRSDEEDGPLVGATPDNGNNIANEPRKLTSPDNAHGTARSTGHITTFPNFANSPDPNTDHPSSGWKAPFQRLALTLKQSAHRTGAALTRTSHRTFTSLPTPLQTTLSTLTHYINALLAGIWRQMNPPLWAMLFALIVASVPTLQHLFFTPGTLINNSLTRAVQQSGAVAVPLILVVLGANLARSQLPQEQLATTPAEQSEERRLLIASLLARMVFPTLFMAPVLALISKYLPVSILDDPIFIIVCFLLTGAPSALQLAQICQINDVYMGAMSRLLVWSYVVVILPNTLVLVLMALEVVEWSM